MIKLRFHNKHTCYYGKITKVTIEAELINNVEGILKPKENSVKIGPDVTYISPNWWIATGKTICKEGDTYNEHIGECIAETKAKIKLYRLIFLYIRELLGQYNLIIRGTKSIIPHTNTKKDCLTIDYYKYFLLWKEEKKHLKDLINNPSIIKKQHD